MAAPLPFQLDVTDALPSDATAGRRILISAWLFYPDDPSKLGARPVVMSLVAGGSYDKRYHHAIIPGRSGYSAAEYLSSLGDIVVLLDHLGVGESTRLPDQKKATRHVCALANHAALQQIYARLPAGDLDPGLPPIPEFTKIGGGHSMGGMQTILQQARHRTYDGVMMIGYSADGVHFYLNEQQVRAADYLPKGEAPDYGVNDRAAQRFNFHWSDVPADVIAADDAMAVVTPASIGHDSIRTNIIRDEAGEIDTPVYICLGERDVSPAPHHEPSYFTSSKDITLHILPRSAHCQSFAGTRHQMWRRMHEWSRDIAGA